MSRLSSFVVICLVTWSGAQAATTSTTMTVSATGAIGASGITATGTASFTNGVPSGAFNATVPLSAISGGSTNAVIPYTITFTGGAGTISGNVTLPSSLLLGGGSGSGSATVTGGTGTYSGAVGSFTLTGTGSIGVAGITLGFTGPGSITTGGGGGTTVTPTITAVQDAGGYTSNIAEGSIFVVKGSNLSASGYNASGFPLLTTYNNVKVTFTPVAGGAGTDAYMIYTYNLSGVNQLAAVLPSTVAAGSYNVTVTSSGTASAGFAVTVVKIKPGLITQDSTGTGLVVAQNFISASQLDINRFTTGSVGGFTISPTRPGGTIIAWATGLGPVTGGDNTASPGFDFTKSGVNVQVIVGGMSITPFYAGRAPGLAGADQIDVTLPGNVPTGCTVPFQISVGGVLSQSTFISIAPDATSSACVAPGFTTSQLQNFDQGSSYSVGGFSLFSISEAVQGQAFNLGQASGGFTKFTGFQLASAISSNASTATQGSCSITTVTSTGGTVSSGTSGTALDAGAVTLTGPAGSNLTNVALTETLNVYSLTIGTSLPIPGAVNGNIVAGTYTLNGGGGKDVGKFTASVAVGAPLVVTGGMPPNVVRSSGLTLNWTGGNASDLLQIVGSSSSTSGTTVTSTSFTCTTTAGQKTFTVPSSILTQMIASNNGSLELVSGALANFTAPLVAGGSIDAGVFFGFSGVGGVAAYQ